MHARSFLTALGALGLMTLGVEAGCKHTSKHSTRAVASSTAVSSSVPSSSSTVVVQSTTLQTSTRPATSTQATTTSSAIPLPKPEYFDPVFTPTMNQVVSYGSVLDITWGYDPYYAGTIKITLIGGPTQGTQQPLGVIASGVDNSLGKFSWTINNDFVGSNAFYGFSVLYENDGVTSQYSNPFHISRN